MCTMGFNLKDVYFLRKKLLKKGFLCNIEKDKRIYISRKSTKDFLNYIGPCLVDCYKYKWDIKKSCH